MLLSRLLLLGRNRHLHTQQRAQFFLDVDDDLGLAQLLLQPLVLTAKALELLGSRVFRRLGARLLPFERREPTLFTLLPPAVDVAPRDALSPQEGSRSTTLSRSEE